MPLEEGTQVEQREAQAQKSGIELHLAGGKGRLVVQLLGLYSTGSFLDGM